MTIAQIRQERKRGVRAVIVEHRKLERMLNRAEAWSRNLVRRKTGVASSEDIQRLINHYDESDRQLDTIFKRLKDLVTLATTV